MPGRSTAGGNRVERFEEEPTHDLLARSRLAEDAANATTEMARKVAFLYKSLVSRGIPQERARYVVIQCLVALFTDGAGIFPANGFLQDILQDCRDGKVPSSDLLPRVFERMYPRATPSERRSEHCQHAGGILHDVDPVDLEPGELLALLGAARVDWQSVSLSIFGNIFEASLPEGQQHATGSHYTPEGDILRIIEPTLTRPLRARIEAATAAEDMLRIWETIASLRILDPACGSGNFLYVAFRELRLVERELLDRIARERVPASGTRLMPKVSAMQFFGIDNDPFAVELARITMSFAAKAENRGGSDEDDVPLMFEKLEANFSVGDALVVDWIDADVIIGNPPFQAKNKVQQELGAGYINEIRGLFPGVSGFVDYCVYWFRKAHDTLGIGGRAGLVGTNTITQTNSRAGGLDYIVANKGVIVDAVKTMPWRGAGASVSVSIVNWIKTDDPVLGKKRIGLQHGPNEPWQYFEVDNIPASLSPSCDVTGARTLSANSDPKVCFQGQTHGHEGFIMSREDGERLLLESAENKDVLFPYIRATQWLEGKESAYDRYVIDFGDMELPQAKKYPKILERVQGLVLPTRKASYEEERERNRRILARNPTAAVNRHHENFYNNWWKLSYRRGNLFESLVGIPRYIIVSQVMKRPVFDFVSRAIHPNASLVVFCFSDDYTFGILQSAFHWAWSLERCSTLTERVRYTSTTIFESFPFPQWGTSHGTPLDADVPEKVALVKRVAVAARSFRAVRDKIRSENGLSLRELYHGIETPGQHPLKDARAELDVAVKEAYGYGLPEDVRARDPLPLLLELNLICACKEEEGVGIVKPGLPSFCDAGDRDYYSDDCIEP
ncbi:MAG: class I SAM-dependent DNA methyltransferase [Candidatus Lokiarchaeota archaeon]|nr:class I SAM-dependent DNA methyltransferase [Candidatus Lokiarchaeota archaeon]